MAGAAYLAANLPEGMEPLLNADHVFDPPNFTLGRMEVPSPTNTMGVKGIGESGAIAAQPAVIDALSHEGVTHLDIPASPFRVWQALQEARGRTDVSRDADLSGRPKATPRDGLTPQSAG